MFLAGILAGSAANAADSDADFVKKMISHDQNTIGLAKKIASQSKDADISSFAKAIVDGREKEIEIMRSWLSAHGQ
jgi:uncharacterized protein (DUF305 family)